VSFQGLYPQDLRSIRSGAKSRIAKLTLHSPFKIINIEKEKRLSGCQNARHCSLSSLDEGTSTEAEFMNAQFL
jgi:hypothetical protein